jgi:uncharacterized protein DUF1420
METAGPFLRFASLILPPPWPALVALVVVLGTFYLGLQLARRLRGRQRPSSLDIGAGFVFVTAIVAALIHILSLLGAANIAVLRIIGGGLATSSLGLLDNTFRATTKASTQRAFWLFKEGTALQRFVLCAAGVTVLGLGLAAFGPPTDIDTLAYHLSVPLDWLAHGGARATPDWLHARLIGVGESLNMLGLAIGTDCLGSVFQFSGILFAIVSLASVAVTGADRVFAIALVASCPVLPFLTLTGKPQLMPTAASTIALALFASHRRTAFAHIDLGTLWLMFGCISFAIACKYSFIPGGVALTILIVGSLWHSGWAPKALFVGFATFVVIAFPVYVRNFQFYGDPLSPVLEAFRPGADPVIRTFSWYLRNFAGYHTLGVLLRAPWKLVVFSGREQLTTVLGAGSLAVVAAVSHRGETRPILMAATFVTLVAMTIGQLQARFFFESYLWYGLAAVLASSSLRKRLLFQILPVQMCLTTAIAIYSAASLFPAALSGQQRERVMTRMAPDYALSKWLDKTLPADAVVASDRRSILFMPRPTLSGDLALMTTQSHLSDIAAVQRMRAALVNGGANVLLVTSPPGASPYGWLTPELGAPTNISVAIPDVARNPWNTGPPYTVLIYDLRKRTPVLPAAASRMSRNGAS